MKKNKYSLIETAIKLFKEKGYNNVTVDDIANECNLSKGAFYHYFKSKAEILGSYNSYTIEKNNIFTDILIKNNTAYEKLWNIIILIYGNSTDNLGPNLVKELVVYDIENSLEDPVTYINGDLSNSRYKNSFEIIHKLIEQGQAEGSIRNDFKPADLLNLFTGGVFSSATNWYSSKGNYNRHEELKTFFEIIFKPI